MFLFKHDKLDIKRRIVSCVISRFNGEKTAKQKQFCSTLLTSRMRYDDVNRRRHLTKRKVVALLISFNVSISQSSSEVASESIH